MKCGDPSYGGVVEITKAYLMLPVGDMDRAVSFYRDVVGLTLEFQSPFWSELRWREATIVFTAVAAARSARAGSGFTSPTSTPRSPRSWLPVATEGRSASRVDPGWSPSPIPRATA